MPGRRRVWAQPDGRRVCIPAPEPGATPPPAATLPLGPPLPPVRAAASSEDAPVKEQPFHDVPDAEVGESSEMDTPFRGGVFQTGSGKTVLLGKDSIQKARATLEEDKEMATHLRFLVSNIAAGFIFGKGGSTINNFQSQSGARIQLSRSHEFFPGTNDRIIMVSGLFDQVVKAMELVLEKLLSEGEESNEAEARPKFKLLVPNSSCGGIIGKGGATIKSFIEDSHAGIKISPQDNNSVGLHDMLVTITGPLNSQMRAIYLILSKLSEDDHYPPNLSSPFPYAGLGFPGYPAAVPAGYIIPQVPYNDAVNYGPNGYAGGGSGRYQNNKPVATMAAAPPPTLPNDLIEEILLRLPTDDPASLLCASLVCKTWSHIAKEQLKRALRQLLQLKKARLHEEVSQLLQHAQLLEFENAQQLQHAQLLEFENAQLQEELSQLQRRAPSCRRRSASSSSSAPSLALVVIVLRSLCC